MDKKGTGTCSKGQKSSQSKMPSLKDDDLEGIESEHDKEGKEHFRNALMVPLFPSFPSLCNKDEVMDQHGQALRVVDIAEQLQARFAYLTGGKGRNGAPIITLPEYPRFQEIQDQDFLSVMTYLTSIPR
uniref:MCF2L n=1 Tax=Branchiostoma floridae TaxID=7739 RepID=C3ZZQ1_BRAFL|eukprot:XP_002585977.1 hypothetical protein BRAFLDRAFT_110316 [Branchiostoma floridae]